MFEALPEAKPDAILALMQRFRADTREEKLDLGESLFRRKPPKPTLLQPVVQVSAMP